MSGDDLVEVEITLPADEAAAVRTAALALGETPEQFLQAAIREALAAADAERA